MNVTEELRENGEYISEFVRWKELLGKHKGKGE